MERKRRIGQLSGGGVVKVFWHSNAPWVSTGYGNQTAQVTKRLPGMGHEVGICAFYGLHGAKLEWNEIPIYPGGADGYANDVYTSHAAHFFGGTPDKSGLIISLVDAWILNPQTASRANHAVWAPVDHEDVVPGVENFFKASGSRCIAMSKSGQEAFARKDIEADFIPHGVDTDLFKPSNRKECREALGVPEDAFMVGMVAANKGAELPRKAFAETLAAFKQLRDKHSDAILYLHTDPHGINQGIDLYALCNHIGVEHDSLRWVDPYQYNGLGCSDAHMVAIYNAMDVLINPAYGEGFGIPVLEAQACGTPVIVQDFTAMQEVGKVGWQVGGQKIWTVQKGYQRVPNIGELVEALMDAYNKAGSKRKSAREHALTFDADLIADTHWKPFLEDAERRLTEKSLESGGVEIVKPSIEVAA